MDSKIIAVDFDGTCVTHMFPLLGKNIGAATVLKALTDNKHELILFTMRSNRPGKEYLAEAVNWFETNYIPLFGINENPEQDTWTDSPKPYAHYYVDDAALGVPLISKPDMGRPFVDWMQVAIYFNNEGLITDTQMVDILLDLNIAKSTWL